MDVVPFFSPIVEKSGDEEPICQRLAKLNAEHPHELRIFDKDAVP